MFSKWLANLKFEIVFIYHKVTDCVKVIMEKKVNCFFLFF